MIAAYVVFPIVLFAIADRLLRRDPLLVAAFFLSLWVFLRFALFKVVPEIAFASGTFINITILLLCIRWMFSEPKVTLSRHAWAILGGVLGLLAYLVALAMMRGDDAVPSLLYVRNLFFNLFLLVLFLTVRARRPVATKAFITFVVVVLAVQIVLGVAQYLSQDISDFFKIVEYERLGELRLAIGEEYESRKVVIGTLRSMQNVSSFVMLMTVFLLSIRLVSGVRHVQRPVLGLIVVSGITMMILSGVRSPIVGLLIGLILIAWQKSKISVMLAGIAGVIVIPVVLTAFASEINYATTAAASVDVERPVERIVGALAVFDPSLFRYTTLRRTLALSESLWDGLVFGSGPGIIFTDYSVTDAFLALFWIEFGLIGLVLLMLPYLYTLLLLGRAVPRRFFVVGLILLLVSLSQSVVNQGLWADFSNAQVVFLLMLLFRMGRESSLNHVPQRSSQSDLPPPTVWRSPSSGDEASGSQRPVLA